MIVPIGMLHINENGARESNGTALALIQAGGRVPLMHGPGAGTRAEKRAALQAVCTLPRAVLQGFQNFQTV